MPHGARLSRPEVPGDHHHGMDSPPSRWHRAPRLLHPAGGAGLARPADHAHGRGPTSFPRLTSPTPQLSAFSILKIPVSR